VQIRVNSKSGRIQFQVASTTLVHCVLNCNVAHEFAFGPRAQMDIDRNLVDIEFLFPVLITN
jgi:hypothetical protein